MFSQDMPISKTLMETLTLASGGRGVSFGGGGFNGELTNWDGTKKKLVGECKVKGEHFPSHIGESPMRLGSHRLLL